MTDYDKLEKLLTESKPIMIKITYENGVSIDMSFKNFKKIINGGFSK